MAASTPDWPLSWTVPRKVRTFLADMAPTEIGKRLKELRLAAEPEPGKRELTQEDLARRIAAMGGTTGTRTISRWETGASGGIYDLNESQLARLAKALGVQPEDIVGPPTRAAVNASEAEEIKALLRQVLNRQDKILNAIRPEAAPARRPAKPRGPRLPRRDPAPSEEAPSEPQTGRAAARSQHGT